MPDEAPLNHGNNVENNYGTIHQYINHKPTGHKPPRKLLQELPKRVRVALLGGLTTVLLSGLGFYTQGAAKPSRAYYCASGSYVKYHASPDCRGLSNCSARVTSTTLARVKQRHMQPCHVCH